MREPPGQHVSRRSHEREGEGLGDRGLAALGEIAGDRVGQEAEPFEAKGLRGVTDRTVQRDWRKARLVLHRQLAPTQGENEPGR